SGAMYRAIGWKALREGVALDDEAAVAALADASLIVVSNARVLIDSVDVTREIRTPEIDRAAAAVARLPRVRAILVAVQRDLGAGGEIVMEGRDIGTVVFPQADVKIYLDAAPEERARRRAQDPSHSRGPAAVSEVKTLLTERDRSDTTRAATPPGGSSPGNYASTASSCTSPPATARLMLRGARRDCSSSAPPLRAAVPRRFILSDDGGVARTVSSLSVRRARLSRGTFPPR